MYQFEKIKLIIWDLDDTFWQGTLSEGSVVIPPENKCLLRVLTDVGIVNSICSKNDEGLVMQRLHREEELEQYFVFPSINWEAKGGRIKQLIEQMQLRPANVLFIDDNHLNREEAAFFCPDIMTEEPSILPRLLKDAQAAEKKDPGHKRLQQYRVLETKQQEKQQYSSNEQFLLESNIQVRFGKDCAAQIDRIADLILRSNQLNFTKLRSSKEELLQLLALPDVDAGYVSVSDRFGDYGIVGFYALRENTLIHFTFSCRTLGMGIEQYVYNTLNRPALTIVGEVISQLDSPELPSWINRRSQGKTADRFEIKDLQEHSVLVKGPCDLFQIYPYIAHTELFDTEFSYTTDRGFGIESTGHTTHIVEAYRLTAEQKNRVLSEVPFTDAGMYKDDIYHYPYKVVFLSILSDANLGVYRRKGTGERLAFLEYLHPITDPKNWQGIISGEYDNRSIRFTEEMLREFSEKYEFIGRNTPEQIVENLSYIRGHLNRDCTMVIMLGGELYYEKNTSEAYLDRHLVHKQINAAVKDFAASAENVRVMDVNRYLHGQDSFYDHFNHYIKPIYYKLAEEMAAIVNECTGTQVKNTSKLKMVQIRMKEALAPHYYRLRKCLKRK